MKTISLISLLLLLFAGCGSEPKTASENSPSNPLEIHLTPVQIKNAGIQTGKISQKQMLGSLLLSGKIEAPPQNIHTITCIMGGSIQSTRLLPGEKIKKGDVLLVLEDKAYIELQEEYLLAKVELERSKKDLDRQQKLNSDKTSSDKNLQEANAQFQTWSIRKKALREKLGMLGIDAEHLTSDNLSNTLTVRSPCDGFVSEMFINVGRYIQAGEKMLELINPKDLHLTLTVFEKDLPAVKVGQKLEAFSNQDTSVRFPCTVIQIGNNLSADRTAEVHCHFDGSFSNLVPGMYMNAELGIDSKTAWVLPFEAVQSFEGIHYVFTSEGNGHFSAVEVKPGLSDETFIEIAENSGLAGKQIVTRGAYALLMQMKNTADE